MKPGLSLILLLLLLGYACKAPKSSETVITQHKKPLQLTIPHHALEKPGDLDVLMKAIGDDRIVLLGGASQGSRDEAAWRAAISKRLLEEKGFNIIAVAGNWQEAYAINSFIKGPLQNNTAALELLGQFQRWPNWVWNNQETAALIGQLNQYNQKKSQAAKIGFYGLDLYAPWESLDALTLYVNNKAIASAGNVQEDSGSCFAPLTADGRQYALAVAQASAECRDDLERLWQAVHERNKQNLSPAEAAADFVAIQQAQLARNGERFYRYMAADVADAWNIRSEHMANTLQRLLEHHGPDSKVIIWAHNRHVGDARYSHMESHRLQSLGELLRKQWGAEHVFIAGFGSYKGAVIAAEDWGAPMQKMELPEAMPGSWEELLHQLGPGNKLVLFSSLRNDKDFNQPLLHRSVGVVYQPQKERHYNYEPSLVHQRYDAFLFIAQGQALQPLGTGLPVEINPPHFYPWGY